MFIGFIAVLIILLVIVGFMMSGVLSSSQSGQYMTEAEKVHSLLNQASNITKFYYVKDETYSGLTMDFFIKNKFNQNNIVVTDPNGGMNSADWDGWPSTSDNGGVFPDPYTGPYIVVNGTAGTDVRIIVSPINNGQNAGFFIVKKKSSSIDPVFFKILEKSLSKDPLYIGG